LFFCGEFLNPKKKKGLANPTKGFLRIFFKNSPYLEKTKVKKSPDLDSVFH
jgi:hypothetical protein